MTQIIENWVQIIGIIIGALPAPDRPGFHELHLRVEEVRPIDGFPALVQAEPGDTLVILVRDPVSGDCLSGARFDARVRAAGPAPMTLFAHPDWVHEN